MAILAALAAATAVAQGVSALHKGRAQKKLANERAEQKRLQQLEIQRRTESEIVLLRERASGIAGLANTQYAGSGVSVTSGAAVQAQMQSYENLGRAILNKRLESKFRDTQLSAEARWERKQGAAFQTSSVISAFGSLLKAGESIYSAYSSPSDTPPDISGGTTVKDAGFNPAASEGIA